MADNLEDLNRQLAEAQERSTQIEQEYSTNRQNLSKIGKEYFKESLLTLDSTKQYAEQLKKLTRTLQKVDESNKAFDKALDEATKLQRRKVEKAKQEVSAIEKRIEEAKKPGFLKDFFSLKSFRSNGENSFEDMIRARQRVQGLGDIFSGNIMSGVRQLGTSFKGLSKFMSGPYYAALELSVKKLLEFDKSLSKASKTSAMMAGGITSSAGTSQNYSRIDKKLDEKILKYPLYQIGMQGRFDDYSSFISKNFGTASLGGIDTKKELYRTLARAEYGLGASGISPDSAMSLVSNLRTLEGKSEKGIYAQLQRLLTRSKYSSVFSPEQAIQQASSLYDQTKHLGTNFEWASRTIQRFEMELKRGTMSLSDFAAANRAFQSGGVSRNAGIGALVADFAGRSGISLPTNFINSNAVGQGFALSSPAMLGNNNFARALSGKITEMVNEMGMNSPFEKAGALQLILQSMGINVSATAAQRSINKNGQIDLISSGIAGSSAFQRKADEEAQAEAYEKEVQQFYKNTESYQKTIADTLSTWFNYWGQDKLKYSIKDQAQLAQINQWRAFASGATEYNGWVYKGTRQEAQEIFNQLVQQATM